MKSEFLVLVIVYLVYQVSAQKSTTPPLEEKNCQEDLQICTDKYDNSVKKIKDLQAYHDCVWDVDCVKHREGYNDRLELLSNIDDMMESQHADTGNWWDDGACNMQVSLTVLVTSLLVAIILFHANVN